jgi:uncharacterized membrane protein
MTNTTIAEKRVGLVMRSIFFVFGVVTTSAAFVVACVLARDHYEYTFVEVWLIIAAVVIIFTIGMIWVGVSLRMKK